MADTLEPLRAQLDGLDPEGFDALPQEDLAYLADAVATAKQRHASELEAAIEASLGHLPRLLRGPVRAIMGLAAGGRR